MERIYVGKATMNKIWRMMFNSINMAGMAKPGCSKGKGSVHGDGMV